MAGPAHLEIGYVARAHGLTGEIAVRPFDPASESLYELSRVLVRTRGGEELELVIDSVRPATKEILLSFEDYDTRTAAEGLVGSTVLGFREDLAAPAEGEYFQADLVGLAAVDEAGASLGKVEAVWDSGPVPNLVIRGPGGELLVPFTDDFVPSVDLEKRRVVIRPPELTD